MPNTKTDQNTQFARTSETGNRTVAIAGPDQGVEPLADLDGRLINRLSLANGFVSSTNPLPVQEVTGTPLFPTQLQLTTLALVSNFSFYVGDGILKQVTGFNDGAVTAYLQLYDRAVIPGIADLPIQSIKLFAGSSFGWSPDTWLLANGLWIALSTTPIGFTSAGVSLWANAILWV